MAEIKDKLVTAESLKSAYDALNNKSYEKLDVTYNKTNNTLVLQNSPELPKKVYVDGTLTKSGNAADAKATGDAIAELKNENTELKDDLDDIIDAKIDGHAYATVQYKGNESYPNDVATITKDDFLNYHVEYFKTVGYALARIAVGKFSDLKGKKLLFYVRNNGDKDLVNMELFVSLGKWSSSDYAMFNAPTTLLAKRITILMFEIPTENANWDDDANLYIGLRDSNGNINNNNNFDFFVVK